MAELATTTVIILKMLESDVKVRNIFKASARVQGKRKVIALNILKCFHITYTLVHEQYVMLGRSCFIVVK